MLSREVIIECAANGLASLTVGAPEISATVHDEDGVYHPATVKNIRKAVVPSGCQHTLHLEGSTWAFRHAGQVQRLLPY